jgi:hypothetical protein
MNPYCLKDLPVLGVCHGQTNKIWLHHVHSFKVKLTPTRQLGDKRRLSWQCYQFWVDHGGSFHLKQPNGYSLPLPDQFYGYSMTRKALSRSTTTFPKAVKEKQKNEAVPPPLPVATKEAVPPLSPVAAKEKQKKESLPPPSPVAAKEKQKKESLRRSSRNIHLFSTPTPLRSPKEPSLPQRETRSTSTTIHQQKKSIAVFKVRKFIIPPPKATQSLTSDQRNTLENFGLQEEMIQRATDLYFW